MGRTQGGNNNAYAQDNEISWVNWDLKDADRELLEFTRRLARLRHSHPVFHRRHFFQGRRIRGSELEDLTWLRPDGEEMTEEEWNTHFTRCFGMQLGGDAMLEWDEHGERVTDDTFLLLFNADRNTIPFTLPRRTPDVRWQLVLTTSDPGKQEGAEEYAGASEVPLGGRSVMILRRILSPQ